MEESSQDYDPEIDIKVKTESCDLFEGEQVEYINPLETEIKTEDDENPQHVESIIPNEDSEEVDIKIENGGDSNFLHFEFETNQEFISEEDEAEEEEQQDPLFDISDNNSSSNNDNNNTNSNDIEVEQEFEVLYEFESPSSPLFSSTSELYTPPRSKLEWEQQQQLLTAQTTSILTKNWKNSRRNKKDPEPYKCPIPNCNYKSSFKWECQLKFHIRTHHTAEPQFPCTEENCERVFYTVHDRTCHMTSHFKYKCPVCEKTFQFEDVLEVHLEIHDQRLNLTQEGPSVSLEPIKREHDPNDFKYVPPSSSILETEAEILNSMHKGGYCGKLRRYTCTCGLNYAGKYTLDRHLSNVLSGRRYKCSTCAKVFLSFEVFKTHLSTHGRASTSKTTKSA